jgi:hypothetical protein
LVLPLLVGTRAVLADDECVVFDTALQGAVTPDQALQRLMDGNARLLADILVTSTAIATTVAIAVTTVVGVILGARAIAAAA